MFIIVSIITIFVFLIIYLYFKVENLSRELGQYKKANKLSRKENKSLVDSLVLVANHYQQFAEYRVNYLIELFEHQGNHEKEVEELLLIQPVIKRYAFIFQECIKEQGQLSTIIKNCFENSDQSYQAFEIMVKGQEASLRKMWVSNSLSGFVSLVEALVLKHGKLFGEAAKKSDQ